jgi:hypothetical protein
MKSYLQLIKEMAVNIGRPYSLFDSKPNRLVLYDRHKKDKQHENITDNIKVHIDKSKFGDNSSTTYTTLDHNKKEALHQTAVNEVEPTKEFPYKHDQQKQVSRQHTKDNSDLPKGHATNVIWNHFLKSKNPLRSSDEQYTEGHKLWHRIVKRALDSGHHVYHWDGNKLHKTTHEVMEDHLSKSFSEEKYDESTRNKHMIISKKKLKSNED